MTEPGLKSAKVESAGHESVRSPSLRGHLAIMRVDHWIKNVFVVPGAIVALSLDPDHTGWDLIIRAVLALLATGFVASSNYTMNEILDAPFDRHHPLEASAARPERPGLHTPWLRTVDRARRGRARTRAVRVPSDRLVPGCAVGHGIGVQRAAHPDQGRAVRGCAVGGDQQPDSHARRMVHRIRSRRPPVSLLVSYWMVGCFFMAIKRFAEIRNISDPQRVAAYRRSLAFFDEPRMLVAIMFYAAASMLFFGAFIVRYRLELILTFPLVALVMALYLSMGFKPESAAQHPEKLYRQPALMAGVSACFVVMVALLFIDLPGLRALFDPTIPECGSAAARQVACRWAAAARTDATPAG